MSDLPTSAIVEGGCDPARCTVRSGGVPGLPSPWHGTTWAHDAGAGPRLVVVVVQLAGQRIGVMGGLDRRSMDRLVDAWNAAMRAAFPVHHAEAWHPEVPPSLRGSDG